MTVIELSFHPWLTNSVLKLALIKVTLVATRLKLYLLLLRLNSIHIFWLFEIINFTSKTQPKKAVCNWPADQHSPNSDLYKIYFINGNHEIPNVQWIQIIYEVAYNFFTLRQFHEIMGFWIVYLLSFFSNVLWPN